MWGGAGWWEEPPGLGTGGDGGELRFSHCSGVFSDGNFTYIVEPREMAGPRENAQVSPPTLIPVAVISVAAAASSPLTPLHLGNLSLTALCSDPSSGSLLLCPLSPMSPLSSK